MQPSSGPHGFAFFDASFHRPSRMGRSRHSLEELLRRSMPPRSTGGKRPPSPSPPVWESDPKRARWETLSWADMEGELDAGTGADDESSEPDETRLSELETTLWSDLRAPWAFDDTRRGGSSVRLTDDEDDPFTVSLLPPGPVTIIPPYADTGYYDEPAASKCQPDASEDDGDGSAGRGLDPPATTPGHHGGKRLPPCAEPRPTLGGGVALPRRPAPATGGGKRGPPWTSSDDSETDPTAGAGCA